VLEPCIFSILLLHAFESFIEYATMLEHWGPIFEKSYDEFTIVKSS